jgi:hypothetical protein
MKEINMRKEDLVKIAKYKSNEKKKEETHTNIRIRKETKAMFAELGLYGESADDVLCRLIKEYKETHTPSKIQNYFKKLEIK